MLELLLYFYWVRKIYICIALCWILALFLFIPLLNLLFLCWQYITWARERIIIINTRYISIAQYSLISTNLYMYRATFLLLGYLVFPYYCWGYRCLRSFIMAINDFMWLVIVLWMQSIFYDSFMFQLSLALFLVHCFQYALFFLIALYLYIFRNTLFFPWLVLVNFMVNSKAKSCSTFD